MLQFVQGNTQNVYPTSHRHQKEIEIAIVNYLVIGGNLPISIMQQSWFAKFMNVIDPKFDMPGRCKLGNMINKTFKAKHKLLRQKLSSVDSVSLTMDMWSDRSMRSFMGQLFTFSIETCTWKSYVLDMLSNHTGDKIGKNIV